MGYGEQFVAIKGTSLNGCLESLGFQAQPFGSSAPSASMEMVTVWCFTWTGVSKRAVGVNAVVRLQNRVDLARQEVTRCPDSPQ